MPDASPTAAGRTALVTGSGGREHALAWAFAQSDSVSQVLVAPGNGGTAGEAKVRNVDVAGEDVAGLVALAREQAVDLTVVGPEDPLADGIVDAFRAADLVVFGPTRMAARLESSKAWARDFMARHDVPHPSFRVIADRDAGAAAVRALDGRCVVKADGLAAGKGVVVADDEEEALAALDAMMVEGAFGAAGAMVLVEERLEGEELSIMALADGTSYQLLLPAQDHKRIYDHDQGPNTGGMGAYAPAPLGAPRIVDEVRRRVIEPTLEGMAAEGFPFSGCLFCGLMITDGGVRVIEFNARFGDPETQAQLPLVSSDLAASLLAAAEGRPPTEPLAMHEDAACVAVVLAAHGYPGAYDKGMPVAGLEAIDGRDGIKVFHAGTRRDGDAVTTTGGRVMTVTARGGSLEEAHAAAYDAIGPGGVHFADMHFRTDIGARALAR